MPSTYAPQDALALVQNFAHGIPLTLVQSNLCDIVNSEIWCFYPWSWSIATLTPIPCVDGIQDYTPTNTDILRPLKIRLARTDVVPVEYRELGFLANLSPELTRKGGLETNTSVGYFASGPFFRLMYAASVGTGQILQIQGEYQRLPNRITDSNLTTVFQFPDRYFNVFVEGLKWKVYQLSDDPRAGGAQYTKNGNMVRGYSGQMGLFMDMLLTEARTEDLQKGDEFQFPESPLGVGRTYWPGLYGV